MGVVGDFLNFLIFFHLFFFFSSGSLGRCVCISVFVLWGVFFYYFYFNVFGSVYGGCPSVSQLERVCRWEEARASKSLCTVHVPDDMFLIGSS